MASSGETNDRLSGGVEKFKTKVIIESSGYNKWYAPAMFKSTCDIDPQYFPFDDQVNAVKLVMIFNWVRVISKRI